MEGALANVILKKVWVKLFMLIKEFLTNEANSKRQNEIKQPKRLDELALSSKDQMNKHLDKALEPKVETYSRKKSEETSHKI